MAYLLTGERPVAAASSHRIGGGVSRWFGRVRAEHKRRASLASLLELEDFRLDDLGISRGDVLAALRRRGS